MSHKNTTCLPLYSLCLKEKTKKAPIVSAALKRAHVFIFSKTYIHLCSNDPKRLIISLLKKYD